MLACSLCRRCISEECRRIDVGVESNICWLLFIPNFPITNNKKRRGRARNEVSRDHRHLLFAWPYNSICLKLMYDKVILYFGNVNDDLHCIL